VGWIAIFAALVSLGGLDTAPAAGVSVENRLLAAEPGQTMSFAVGDRDEVARVDRDGFTSPDIELRRSPNRLRGHVGAESAELVLGPGRITGQIGDSPVSLDVLRSGNRLRIEGQFGSRAIALDIRPGAVAGMAGPCLYDLTLQGAGYRGRVTCGAAPKPVRLRVAAAFVAQSDVEIAAILTALLAR